MLDSLLTPLFYGVVVLIIAALIAEAFGTSTTSRADPRPLDPTKPTAKDSHNDRS